MQTRFESLKETLSNSWIGILIGLVAMRIMLPLIEDLDKNTQSLIVVGVMFVLSSSRTYIIRRYFNKKGKNNAI